MGLKQDEEYTHIITPSKADLIVHSTVEDVFVRQKVLDVVVNDDGSDGSDLSVSFHMNVASNSLDRGDLGSRRSEFILGKDVEDLDLVQRKVLHEFDDLRVLQMGGGSLGLLGRDGHEKLILDGLRGGSDSDTVALGEKRGELGSNCMEFLTCEELGSFLVGGNRMLGFQLEVLVDSEGVLVLGQKVLDEKAASVGEPLDSLGSLGGTRVSRRRVQDLGGSKGHHSHGGEEQTKKNGARHVGVEVVQRCGCVVVVQL